MSKIMKLALDMACEDRLSEMRAKGEVTDPKLTHEHLSLAYYKRARVIELMSRNARNQEPPDELT